MCKIQNTGNSTSVVTVHVYIYSPCANLRVKLIPGGEMTAQTDKQIKKHSDDRFFVTLRCDQNTNEKEQYVSIHFVSEYGYT